MKTCRYGAEDCDKCRMRIAGSSDCGEDGDPCEVGNYFSADEIAEQFQKRLLLTGVPIPKEYADLITAEFWDNLEE